MRGSPAISIDDDLAAGDAGIAVRAADLEAAGGVHQEACVGDHRGREHRLDDFLDHRLGQLVLGVVHRRVVLGRQHHGFNRDRLAAFVTHGDLRLRVGTQERQAAVAAHFALPLHQPVRVIDGKRHQRWRLVARIAEHQALVARTLVQVIVGRAIDTLRDVGRLPAVADHHRTAVGIEAQLRVVVADRANRVARHAGVIDVGFGGDLARHHDESGGDQRFRGDPSRGVLL